MNALCFKNSHELLQYAYHTLSGQSVWSIVQAQFPQKDFSLWESWQREKGCIGQSIDRFLGVKSRCCDIDFPELGVEVKTLPLTAQFLPAESTFIAWAPLRANQSLQWEDSSVFRKMKTILWTPFLKPSKTNFKTVPFTIPFLWTAGQETLNIVKTDWQQLSYEILMGRSSKISAHLGEYIQLRPKGKNHCAKTWGYDEFGALQKARPKAFYLRREVTRHLLQKALAQSTLESFQF